MNDRPMKTVVVTGASTGIGRSIALRMAERGHAVVAGVRRDEDGHALVAAGGPNIRPVHLDVTDEDSIAAAVSEIELDATGLTALVNNAGIAIGGPVEGLALDRWRQQFEVNLFGQVAVTKAFLPAIRRGHGRLVFISSNSGVVSTPMLAPYCASKHAVEALGFSLREELRPWGIRVSMVLPGAIATPIWDKAKDQAAAVDSLLTPELAERYSGPIEKMAELIAQQESAGIPPEKVADAVEHAITSKRPRYRYYVGADAKVSGAAARLLPGAAFGAFLRRAMP